jgi:hypothetical protein
MRPGQDCVSPTFNGVVAVVAIIVDDLRGGGIV